MTETRQCTGCGSEFDVNVHPVTLCGHCECDGRNEARRNLHPLFKGGTAQWIRLNQHGLAALSILYKKGEAQALEGRTPDEEAFFLRFCEVWDYREYCNRTRLMDQHSWWFRLQQRIKFWILNRLE